MERLTSPLTVQNVQAEIQKDVKTAGFKTAFMAMQETLEDVVKPKTQKPSSHYASGLSTSLRLSAPLASTESSDISNIGITNKSLTEAEISRNATASPAVHLFTQVPSIGSSMPTRLSPNSSGLTVEGVKSGKPLTSTDSITATNNGVTTARLTSKEITNVYTRVDPPHIPTALADYKRRIQRMKEESKLGLKSSVSAGNMDAYRNVLPIYAKTGRLEPIADGSGQTEPIKMDTHPNPPDIIPPEERLGVHLRQNPIDLRLGDTKGQLFYTNVVPSGRVPEPDVLHIRADTLRAAKRRSWAATEHSNNSGNSEADNIRWLLHQEQLKGRTNVNLSELFAKLSKPEGQQTTSAAVELSEISVPSARRGSYRSATDEKSDLLAPIELSESVRNDSLAPTNQRGRNWSADTPDLELDQQEMIERQQPEENSIEDEGFTEFIDESTQPVTCIDSNSQSVLNPSDQATHIDIDPDRPDSQIAVVFPPATKGILKPRDAESKGIRIRFDPMALLLDASLEGELELVKTSAMQV